MILATKCEHKDRPVYRKHICHECHKASRRTSQKRPNGLKNTCGHPDAKHEGRGMCEKCYRAWYSKLENVKERRNLAARNSSACKAATRRCFLKREYGITEEIYGETEKSQGGLCAICGQLETRKNTLGNIRRLAIDHDHLTGQFRGLLCCACNHMLGNAKDNADILRSAITYLESAQICASLT